MVIAVLGTVPVLSGLLGIVGGPAALPSGEAVNATVDGEYRFTNVFVKVLFHLVKNNNCGAPENT